MELSRVLSLRTNWSAAVQTYLSKKLKSVSSRKNSALTSLIKSVKDAERCIFEGALHFTANKITPSYLANRTATAKETNQLVYEWAWPDYSTNPKHIWRFGMTKSFLFLNEMGLALDHCPPSWQVLKFVEDDLGRNVAPSLYHDEPPAVAWANAYIAIGEVRTVARQIASRVRGVTTADVGNALWYWKSAQHLLAFSRGALKRKLTPERLLDFLGKTRSSLESFGSELSDIDSIDNLTSELKTFLLSIP